MNEPSFVTRERWEMENVIEVVQEEVAEQVEVLELNLEDLSKVGGGIIGILI